MVDTTSVDRCPGCFAAPAGSGPCPVCGFASDTPRPVNALPPYALLHDQFIVGRVLGNPGGFGITYLAFDRHLQAPLALKEYLPRDLATRAPNGSTIVAHTAAEDGLFRYGLEQFLNEARTLAQLDHPNIVRVRHFFEANGSAYLVMDYYRGLSLAEYLDRQPGGRIPQAQALALMQPLLDGLAAVHAKGFLHRDIKPGNIYLAQTDNGGARPILLDFGAARQAMGERSHSYSLVLSMGYAPFEQYHRKGHQGPWTDVYAAAVVLYRMLTGVKEKDLPSAVDRHNADDLLPATHFGICAPVSDALAQAMCMDPAGRPQSAREFRDLLDRAIRPDPPTGATTTTPATGQHTATLTPMPARRWSIALVPLAAVLALGAATAAWQFQQQRQRQVHALGQEQALKHRRDDVAFGVAQTAATLAAYQDYLRDCTATGCTHRAAAEERVSPRGQEAALALTLAERAEAQHWLGLLGLGAVPLDGALSAATRTAVAGFQRANGLPESGFLDLATYGALVSVGSAKISPPPAVGLSELFPSGRDGQTLAATARLLETQHYLPLTIDSAFATRVIARYLDALDPSRLYFLARDIKRFRSAAARLAQDIGGQADYFFDIYRVYRMRADERTASALAILKAPLDLTSDESDQLDRSDADWANSDTELDALWRRAITNALLTMRLAGGDPDLAVIRLVRRYQANGVRIQTLTPGDVMTTAVNAVVAAADAQGGSYSPPDQAQERQRSFSVQDFAGIGAVLGTDDYTRFHAVRQVLPQGPAIAAGVRDGDLILALAQARTGAWQSAYGFDLKQLVSQIRGPAGSVVRLRLGRELPDGTATAREVAIERNLIKQQDIASRVLDPVGGGAAGRIGLISVSRLYLDTAAAQRGNADSRSSAHDLERAIRALQRQPLDGLILDLRGNGGGYLSEASAVAGLFIDTGDILRLKDRGGRITAESDPNAGAVYSGPLAVLSDEETASGTEMLVAALQDYGRAVVIGGRTFGKGSMQTLIELTPSAKDRTDLGLLQLTTKMSFRPNGGGIQLRGVTPDIPLPTDSERFARHGDTEGVLDAERITPDRVVDYGFHMPAGVLQRHRERMREDPVFQLAEQRLRRWEQQQGRRVQSLNLARRQAEHTEQDAHKQDLEALVKRLISAGQAQPGEDFNAVLKRRAEQEAAAILRDCIASGAFRTR